MYLFIRDFVCTQLSQKDISDIWDIERPILLLKEVCAHRRLSEPEPRLIGSAGTNTILPSYHVGVFCEHKLLGDGFGETVDIAIDAAARHCLAKLFGIDNQRPFNYKLSLYKLIEIREKF